MRRRRPHKPKTLTPAEKAASLKAFIIDDDPPVPEWLVKLGEKANAIEEAEIEKAKVRQAAGLKQNHRSEESSERTDAGETREIVAEAPGIANEANASRIATREATHRVESQVVETGSASGATLSDVGAPPVKRYLE